MTQNAEYVLPREVIIDGVRYIPASPAGATVVKANPCRECGASAVDCERSVRRRHRGCCNRCYAIDTHDMTTDDWRAFAEAAHIDCSGAGK